MAKPTQSTISPRERFLQHLALSSNVSESSRVAGIDRTTAYDWRSTDEVFKAAWEDALEQATDILEAEARRRAVEGEEEYVVSGGRVVMHPETGQPLTQRKRSDALTVLLLKAHRPDRFKDRAAVETSGKVVINISSDDANL